MIQIHRSTSMCTLSDLSISYVTPGAFTAKAMLEFRPLLWKYQDAISFTAGMKPVGLLPDVADNAVQVTRVLTVMR